MRSSTTALSCWINYWIAKGLPFDKYGLGFRKVEDNLEEDKWSPKTPNAGPSMTKDASYVPAHDNKDGECSRTHQEADLEEAKRIEEALRNQLEKKEMTNQKIEMEVVGLRKKIEKSNYHEKFNNSSIMLDKLLDCQRSPL